MRPLISRKIIIYLFLFFFLVTINNLNLKQFDILSINQIEISGLDMSESERIKKDISYIKEKNLFFLDELELSQKFNSNVIIEKINVFKKYPSTLKIEVEKTKFLANINKDNLNFYIGSNGKLIKSKKTNQKLPFIFGNPEAKEFLDVKNTIDKSNFDFKKIKNLYYFKSKRWDIETHNGNIIKLSNNDLISSLDLSARLLKDEKFKFSTLLDLRQKNQIIINE